MENSTRRKRLVDGQQQQQPVATVVSVDWQRAASTLFASSILPSQRNATAATHLDTAHQ